MEKNPFLLIGKIVGVHGLKGNIKVVSFAESATIFKPGNRLLVRNTGTREKMYEIRWAKPQSRNVLLALDGVDRRSLSEMLIGSELFVEKRMIPEPEQGAFFWSDIIGLDVYTTEEEYLGRVESIIETGSNDVYVVKDSDREQNHEILVPALESVVVAIDLNRKMMRVDLPEGLR